MQVPTGISSPQSPGCHKRRRSYKTPLFRATTSGSRDGPFKGQNTGILQWRAPLGFPGRSDIITVINISYNITWVSPWIPTPHIGDPGMVNTRSFISMKQSITIMWPQHKLRMQLQSNCRRQYSLLGSGGGCMRRPVAKVRAVVSYHHGSDVQESPVSKDQSCWAKEAKDCWELLPGSAQWRSLSACHSIL
jgi:hypothetical protein